MRAWCVLLLLEAAPPGSADPRPSPTAVRKALEANQPAMVEVMGPHHSGAGIVVGADGQVLTSNAFVGLESAQVKVGERTWPAKVVMANAALKVALLAVATADGGSPWPSAAVALGAPLVRGTWVVGLERTSNGTLRPRVGQISRAPTRASPFFQAEVPLEPGSPLLDGRGRLVAVAVESRGDACRALPLAAVKVQLTSVPEP